MSLLSGYVVKTVLDLSPGAGNFAEACLLTRCGHGKVFYFGLCLSEAHMNGLRERLEFFVLQQMMTEGSPLYVARCAEAFKSQSPKPPSKEALPSKRDSQGKTRTKESTPVQADNTNKTTTTSTTKGTPEKPAKLTTQNQKKGKSSEKPAKKQKMEEDNSSWDLSASEEEEEGEGN